MIYQKAIARRPSSNFAAGLSGANLGLPNFELTLKQHQAYCDTLKRCGLEIILLEADENYPDGCFVEDTAIITEVVAIITRPGASSRTGEEEKIREILSNHMQIEQIISPGHVDGGDVLRVNNHFYIGLSKRTNLAGSRQLSKLLSKYGFSSSEIPVKSVLHLKTGVTYIGKNSFLAIEEFSDRFHPANVIQITPQDAYYANCMLVNNNLLVPKGMDTSKYLSTLNYPIIEIPMSEFQKMDGGLTCLSLLF